MIMMQVLKQHTAKLAAKVLDKFARYGDLTRATLDGRKACIAHGVLVLISSATSRANLVILRWYQLVKVQS